MSCAARLTWNKRVRLDPVLWMADEARTKDELIESGKRDFRILTEGLSGTWLSAASALEIGCGTGRLLYPALGSVRHLTGIDPSDEALKTAATWLGDTTKVTLINGNGVDLAEVTGRFNLIYSFATFGHLSPPIVVSYFREIKRLLADDGEARIQLYVGNEVLFSRDDTFSIRSYDRERLRQACHLAGLDVHSFRKVSLPFDGADRELQREPVILSLRQGISPISTETSILDALVRDIEPEGGARGSRDEYRYLLGKANKCLRQHDITGAERYLSFAIESYEGAEQAEKDALLKLQRALEQRAGRESRYEK